MKLKFKIFEIRREMYISTKANSQLDKITQSCFEEVIVFKSLEKAKKWKDDNQKFKGQYVIYNCF